MGNLNGEGTSDADQRLPVLKILSDLLEQAGDLAQVIDCVQLEFPSYLDVDRVSLLVYDAAQGALVSGHLKGAHCRPCDGSCAQTPKLSISGLCFSEARAVVVNDCSETDIIPLQYVENLGLRSTVAIPILLEGLPMGVLRLDDTRRLNRFSGNDVEFYQLVAERISFAIRNFQMSADRTLAEEALRLVCEELEQRIEERSLELARTNEALNRELEERRRAENIAEVFAGLGLLLSQARTPQDAAEATLQAAENLFGWDAALVNLVVGDNEVQVIYEADLVDGERKIASDSPSPQPMGPLIRRAVEDGPQLILRFEADGSSAGNSLPFGNKKRRSVSMMYAPVRRLGHNIGVVSIQSYSPAAYGPKELELLGSLAAFCSGALERTAAAEGLRLSQQALQQETQFVQLLGDISGAANQAESIGAVLQTAVDRVCQVTGWPLGHALIRKDENNPGEYVSAGIWHLAHPDKYARFRTESESMTFGAGVSLPGLVLESGAPAIIFKTHPLQPWMKRSEALEEAGFCGGVAFPVMAGSEIVAVLEFFSEQVAPPSPRLLEVMGHVGVQLGRVVERQRAEERLLHGARHDVLTGLPNRGYFLDYLERASARSRRHPEYRFAVLFLDLDRFKLINESLGHEAGDRFLVVAARRLEGCLREGDTVARLGGDEFAILLDDVESPTDAVAAADRILGAFAKPVTLGSCDSYSGASIGIVLSRPGGDNLPADLLRDADVAMYRAKQAGRSRYAVFDEKMHADVLKQLQMETELRQALERNELITHYQPIVTMIGQRIVGFEALVRWNHPQRGLLFPADFIPLAEETGLIVPLGWEVLRQACAWMRRRLSTAPEGSDLAVSVNITARQLREPDLLERIQEALTTADLPARHLHLEVTEGSVMENVEQTVEVLGRLHDLGVQVLVDDFGTGYSSLSYLARFPIDALKIDQSFIRDLASSEGNAEVVQAILALACGLRLGVVAEGVETMAQLAQLRGLGCELTQGFLFSRPMDAEAALALPLTVPEPVLS